MSEICCNAAEDGTQQASLDLQGNGTLQSLGSDISPITLSVENVDQNILRVKMGANGRFEVPETLFQNIGQGDSLAVLWPSAYLTRHDPLCQMYRVQHALQVCMKAQAGPCTCTSRRITSAAQAGCRGIQTMDCSTARLPLGLLSHVWDLAQQPSSTLQAIALFSRCVAVLWDVRCTLGHANPREIVSEAGWRRKADADKTAPAALQDQYLELTSSIPLSATLFGLGEFTTNTGFPLRRDGLPYTLWTRDQPPAVPNINLYGSHPIIMDVRDGTSSTLQMSRWPPVDHLYAQWHFLPSISNRHSMHHSVRAGHTSTS